MPKMFKTAVMSAAIAATGLAAIPADAGPRRWHGDWPAATYRDRTGDVVAAGIFGLAVGAIIASAITHSDQQATIDGNPYRHPRPSPDRDYFGQDYFPSAPQGAPQEAPLADSRIAPQPWSSEWERWCFDHHRDFDPDTGTYTGANGNEYFCLVR